LPEPGYRTVDDAGVVGAGLLVVDPQLLQRSDTKVLQHHVEDFHQAKKQFLAGIFLEVDLDIFLLRCRLAK
jgi:hypothetical protein